MGSCRTPVLAFYTVHSRQMISSVSPGVLLASGKALGIAACTSRYVACPMFATQDPGLGSEGVLELCLVERLKAFYIPRLAKPSPTAKHKQMLLFHAEAKDLGTRWSVETTQKHLPVRFLYDLAPMLICFSFHARRKLQGSFWACSKNSSSRNVPGTGLGNVPGTGLFRN